MDGEASWLAAFRPLRLHRSYRLRLEREGNRVRLITRGGYDWSDPYSWIVESTRKSRFRQFVIDDEAVLLAFTGIADFDGLHSRKYDEEVQLYAFDILALDGDDPAQAAAIHAQDQPRTPTGTATDGIFITPFEQGEIAIEAS